MFKFGLKLWSINTDNYLSEAQQLYVEKIYDYIELYVVPDTLYTLKQWKELEIPFIIHAPHFKHGLNLAKVEQVNENLKKADETKKFADELNAQHIIFHPGYSGKIEETARQINLIDDARILIENKPYFSALKENELCNGSSIKEIRFILDNTNAGFCLDINHCFCSANAQNINQYAYLNEFLTLSPKMFHLTDNDFSSPIDKHLHFGCGNFDFNKILNFLPDNSIITIETNKNSNKNLDDFVVDINHLKSKTKT